jgi:Maltose acetyltransferase
MEALDETENEARMARGELYYAFMPGLVAKRMRCHHACHRFNVVGEASRRRLVELWREYVHNKLALRLPR